jgi:hypothetical protein
MHYVVTEPTDLGNFLTFCGWFLVVVAVLNMFRWFGGK